ncbi:hypothetical protein [Paracoccus aminophilus]|uniref:Sialate O-acetylesterase domain-containing protein n=1 Tax=Paracoccus aminophilus JCM 7686 TaxID=1367847 RepID=S5YXN3_PARAH|nr:hypothetical protein [Paracoccus aminophilus]AGT09966.1 hypothetical protein JCM7686_2911 [Paracoccus aminophilus JCM 7686]
MVTTTKTPGEIYPNGSAVPKADIRTWMTEMQTGTNAELTDLRNGRLWHSSSTNLSAQTPPPGTNQIIVANNSGTFNWRRLGSAPNPVNPAIHAQTADAAWWYLSEDTPAIKARVSAVETDLPNGRVWRYARNDLTPVGATPPTGTQMIAVHKTTGSGQADWVRRSAPTSGGATDVLVQDATGQWWGRTFSTTSIESDLAAKADTSELRSGRVWQYANNSLTIDGAIPPTGTQCIDVTKSVGTESAKWVRASAPSDGVVTDTLRRDGTGNQWWRRASSSQVLRDDMYDGAVKRVVANNLRPSGITVPAGAKVLVITKGNAPGEAIWATIGRLPDLPETDEYAKDLDAKWWILRWSSEWVARDHPTFAQMQAALATVSGSGSGGGYTPPEPLPASATLLPRRVGGVTQLVGDAGIGAAARYTVGGDGAWHWLPSRVAIVMVLGQSNAAVSEMEGPPLYIPAKTPDFVLMSNDGVGELGALRGWNGQPPGKAITGFVPAEITGVQSSAEALASASNALDPRGAGVIYAGSHGRGGAGFTATDPNFAIWKVLPSGAPAPQRIRMIEWVTAVMTYAPVPPTEIVIAFTHGETNRRDPWATYTADGLGYMADIEADLAFTGLPVVWLVDIPGGTTAMSAFGSDWQVKYALRELMRQARLAGHRVVDVGPRYHLPMGTARGGTPDHIHTSYLSQVRLREMDAFAYRNHVAGLPWWCAFPKGERAAGLGNKVILAVESLTPIMIDRDMVPLDPHLGFSLSNDSATITGVEQTGDREITLSLSGTPNSSARLQYVYRRPNAGEIDTRYVTSAGSIREVWQGTGPITGLPVYRPMHSFEVPIA